MLCSRKIFFYKSSLFFLLHQDPVYTHTCTTSLSLTLLKKNFIKQKLYHTSSMNITYHGASSSVNTAVGAIAVNYRRAFLKIKTIFLTVRTTVRREVTRGGGRCSIGGGHSQPCYFLSGNSGGHSNSFFIFATSLGAEFPTSESLLFHIKNHSTVRKKCCGAKLINFRLRLLLCTFILAPAPAIYRHLKLLYCITVVTYQFR